MDPRKSEHTPADYVAMAVAPALIMGLVGSLIFFLLEILYAGEYTGRLQWLLFFFVFGAVLIARIAMQPDIASHAHIYGGVMGLLVWIGLLQFIEYPASSVAADFAWAINLGLIALIWWCAYQLTWDCTFLDDRLGSSGQGVLQAAGLDEGSKPQEEDETEQDEKKESPRPIDWLERYRRYREKRDQKRTPGVWVIYFSLAALPIFGLGQSLIPVAEAGRRRYSFWLMVVYVGCGLGLLLTTTFLGLRTYLRRRKLQMPAAMTGVWLTVGGTLIALLLAGGALLPRPSAEVQLFNAGSSGSKSQNASRSNVKEGDPGKEDGDPNGAREDKGKPGNKGGQRSGDRQAGNSDRRGNQGGANRERDKKDNAGGSRDDKKESGSGRKDGPSGKDRKDKEEKEEGEGTEREETSRQESRSLSKETSSFLRGLAPVLKWIVFGLLAVVVLFFILRAFLQFTASFSTIARNLLDSLRRFWEALLALFGRKPAKDETEEVETLQEFVPARPFSSFANPFQDGRADRLSLPELIRYTFAALEAWAHERDLGREQGETPLEFAGRVGEEVPPLQHDVQRLAALYARAVYARSGLPANGREILEQFWDKLAQTAEQPLSA